MADASRDPTPSGWSDAFAALPLESPPASRWPQIAVSRHLAPLGPAGYGRRAVVQVDDEFFRGTAEDILLVNPADNLGLLLVDLPQPCPLPFALRERRC